MPPAVVVAAWLPVLWLLVVGASGSIVAIVGYAIASVAGSLLTALAAVLLAKFTTQNLGDGTQRRVAVPLVVVALVVDCVVAGVALAMR